MKSGLLAALMLAVLTLTGCGSSHHYDPVVYNTQILSDATLDGYIFKPAGSSSVPIPYQDVAESYAAGFDSTGEWRAFLQFPLGGGGGVPAGAIIDSATLNLFVHSTYPGAIPIRIDLVDLDPPDLVPNDFNLTPLASITVNVPRTPTNLYEEFFADVTALMRVAQNEYRNRPFRNFQVRILIDPAVITPGEIKINDTTVLGDREFYAPLLDVFYY